MEKRKIPLIAVVGPTASGKTGLAIHLAKQVGGEVISADSMQVYREMSIGTARPSVDEMEGVPHHLMGCCSISESFHVAKYAGMAQVIIKEVWGRGRLPILCGGTGLYVQAVVDQIDFSSEGQDGQFREQLRRRAEQDGGEALLRELAAFDPETAEKLHPNNVGRIIRAIEIYRKTGVTMSEQLRRSKRRESDYRLFMLGITYRDRQKLYERIERRVDNMLERGLVEEARAVLSQPGGKTALQAIGYKELAPYLRGEATLEQAVSMLKQETRRYAKRQLTWFRRDQRVHWIYADDYANPMEIFRFAQDLVEHFLSLCYTDENAEIEAGGSACGTLSSKKSGQ